MHILPNIIRSRGYQTMKFGQLIKYNIRNFFLEKSYKQCSGESIPKPFSRKSKWAYLWINSFILFVFSVCKVEDYQNMLKLSCRPLLLPDKTFLKMQNRSENSLLPHWCDILLTDQIYLSDCLYFVRYWQYLYCTSLFIRLWRHKIWN